MQETTDCISPFKITTTLLTIHVNYPTFIRYHRTVAAQYLGDKSTYYLPFNNTFLAIQNYGLDKLQARCLGQRSRYPQPIPSLLLNNKTKQLIKT